VIEYDLPYVDDSEFNSTSVSPFELFLGFKSEYEGALESTLQLYKKNLFFLVSTRMIQQQ